MAIGDQLQTIAPGDKLILDARSNVVGIQGGHNSGEPLRLPGFIELVTADDTLIKRSNGCTKVNTTASIYTLTIAKNMPEGYGLSAVCTSTGKITFAAASGVTLNEASSLFSTGGQWKVVALVQYAPDCYVLCGATGA